MHPGDDAAEGGISYSGRSWAWHKPKLAQTSIELELVTVLKIFYSFPPSLIQLRADRGTQQQEPRKTQQKYDVRAQRNTPVCFWLSG